MIIYKSQLRSTSLWSPPKFQSIKQDQPNIYSSLCLHQPTHDLDPLITLPSKLKPPHFLLHPHLIWAKHNLPLQHKKYSPVLIITMSNKMQNPKKAFPNKMQNLMQNLIISSRPCHFRYKKTIKIFHLDYIPRTRKYLLSQHPKMNNFIRWAPKKISTKIEKAKTEFEATMNKKLMN